MTKPFVSLLLRPVFNVDFYEFLFRLSIPYVRSRRWAEPITCRRLKLVLSGPTCNFVIPVKSIAIQNIRKYCYITYRLLFRSRFRIVLSDRGRVWRLGKCTCNINWRRHAAATVWFCYRLHFVYSSWHSGVQIQ